jgi:hypothetical protein
LLNKLEMETGVSSHEILEDCARNQG